LWRADLAGRRGVRIRHLAPAAQAAPTTVDRWLARLEGAGLVERVPDPVHRNGVYARLTRRAATAMATHHKAAAMARVVG
jgi:DNA-binding MarR family transcriptional regulator